MIQVRWKVTSIVPLNKDKKGQRQGLQKKTTSSRESVKKLAKDVKNISRVFKTENTQLQRLKKADSDLSDSEDEDKASHFQMVNINFGKSDFEFAKLNK